MKKLTMGLVLGGLLLAGGASAQEAETTVRTGIMPGNPFFFVERFMEGVGDVFTFGEAAKARRAALIAEKRLNAAENLAERDEEASQRALELYERKSEEARRRAEASGDEETLARVAEATSRHLIVLERVLEQVPEQAKEAITRAIERSRTGNTEAMRALSERDPEMAEEVRARVEERRQIMLERRTEMGMPVPGREGVREVEVRQEVRQEARQEVREEMIERMEEARETREFESLRPQSLPQRPVPAR